MKAKTPSIIWEFRACVVVTLTTTPILQHRKFRIECSIIADRFREPKHPLFIAKRVQDDGAKVRGAMKRSHTHPRNKNLIVIFAKKHEEGLALLNGRSQIRS